MNVIKYFKELYCMPGINNYVPKRNDFKNLREYFIKNAMIEAICRYRNEDGCSNTLVRTVLFEQVKYNDNTHNPVYKP
jgi:hypothetical protein